MNEGAQNGNGNGSGDGTGRQRGRGRGWRPVDEHRMGTATRITGTGTKIGSGRAEERRKSARNREIVVNAMRETGETYVERGTHVEKKGLVQYVPTQIAGRESTRYTGLK